MMQNLNDYQGRFIRFTDERLAPMLGHPELVELESQIVRVLQEPQVVRQSNSDEQVQLYYRYYSDPIWIVKRGSGGTPFHKALHFTNEIGLLYEQTRVGAKWLCVVVKHLPNDAFIITAYLTDKLKQGVKLWQNP